MKKGQLVVIIGAVSDCGCSNVPVGTIAKVLDINLRTNETEIQFCQNACTVWVNQEKDIRALKRGIECATAKGKYAKASDWKYASIN